MLKEKIKWTFLALFLVIILSIPFYFISIGGFMDISEIYHRPIYIFPPSFNLEAYKEAFNELLPYMRNSIIISLGVLVLTLCVSLPSAFVLAKVDFVFKDTLILFYTFVQMLPISSLIIPLFLIFNKINLINNYASTIFGISTITVPFSVIIATSCIKQIPDEILESARIDGANLYQIFREIILPLSRSSIISISILTYIMAWSDFLVSLSFLKNKNLQPMSVGLYNYIGQFGVQWNKLMAGSVIYTLPVIFLVMILGRYIVSGIIAGSLKE